MSFQFIITTNKAVLLPVHTAGGLTLSLLSCQRDGTWQVIEHKSCTCKLKICYEYINSMAIHTSVE